MRTILHSCTSKSFSGLESYVVELATWQKSNGQNVLVFCREGTELANQLKKNGVETWVIENNAIRSPLLWAQMSARWGQLQKAGEVALHMHAGGEPWFHLPWLFRRDRAKTKTILHFHIWINHQKKDPLHHSLYLGIDEVWTSSESSRENLSKQLPISRQKIRVVPYGRDVKRLLSVRNAMTLEKRKNIRRRFGIDELDRVAICVARFEPIKGVKELFDAFVQIAPRHPNAYLLIVGAASPQNLEAAAYEKELRLRHQALAQDIGVRLQMPGFVSGVEELLAISDFYVLPSYEECMSLAMLDAAILGLPVLGTASGGTPSIARPGETGDLFAPKDARGLAVKLEKFFREREETKRLGLHAAALVSGFEQNTVFEGILENYSKARAL